MSPLLRDALRSAVALGLALAVGLTSAQTMYRCGSVYQDRPCAHAQDSRVIGRGQPAEPGAAIAALDTECAARGEVAQRIMWRREAGMTAAEQQGVHREPGDVVADVYRRRGGSAQVRQSIESDCMAEKSRSAQAVALMETLARLKAQAASVPPTTPAPATSTPNRSLQR